METLILASDEYYIMVIRRGLEALRGVLIIKTRVSQMLSI